MNKFIPVNEPLLTGNEKKYLSECIDTGWISSEGPFVKKFESEMAKSCNRKYAKAVSSGTSALELAIQALDIGVDDEVILPALTIISCSNAIIKTGGTPVLVDVSLDTWTMDPQEIEKRITKKTKAIMLVHLYGLPADIDPILEIAKKYNLKVIEDAAEAHGSYYKGKPCGSFGDISIFSFYANKHITTGEGGMVLTDNPQLANKVDQMRNHCFMQGRRFLHDGIGSNMRMTNIQAAVGVAQLERLDYFIQRKKEMGRAYTEALKHVSHITLPLSQTHYAENTYWVYGIVIDSKYYNYDKIISDLKLAGIGTRPFFWPLHQQPIYKTMGLFKDERFSNSENLSQNGFYIPSGLNLNKQTIERVGKTVIDCLKR